MANAHEQYNLLPYSYYSVLFNWLLSELLTMSGLNISQLAMHAGLLVWVKGHGCPWHHKCCWLPWLPVAVTSDPLQCAFRLLDMTIWDLWITVLQPSQTTC